MEWEKEMAHKFHQGEKKGKAEGRIEGQQQKAIENAKTMLADNLSLTKVSQYSGLPIEKVLELQKSIPIETLNRK